MMRTTSLALSGADATSGHPALDFEADTSSTRGTSPRRSAGASPAESIRRISIGPSKLRSGPGRARPIKYAAGLTPLQLQPASNDLSEAATSSVTPSIRTEQTLIALAALVQFTAADSACSAYPHPTHRIRCATQTREYPASGQAAAASGAGLDAIAETDVRRLGR